MLLESVVCLSAAIFFEVRSEPEEAWLAVADTIMTRVEDKRYPNTVCDVVFEPKQFSFTHDGLSDDPTRHKDYLDVVAYQKIYTLSVDVLTGLRGDLKPTHYVRKDVDIPWENHYIYLGRIGDHDFYRNDTKYR
jgi:hypothetical protein